MWLGGLLSPARPRLSAGGCSGARPSATQSVMSRSMSSVNRPTSNSSRWLRRHLLRLRLQRESPRRHCAAQGTCRIEGRGHVDRPGVRRREGQDPRQLTWLREQVRRSALHTRQADLWTSSHHLAAHKQAANQPVGRGERNCSRQPGLGPGITRWPQVSKDGCYSERADSAGEARPFDAEMAHRHSANSAPTMRSGMSSIPVTNTMAMATTTAATRSRS